jgi:manganese transport protein
MSSQSDGPHRTPAIQDTHRSVSIRGSRWRRLFAFAGPAYLISVGYMDPGNWATDLEGGSKFGYELIWVLLMSNLMALLLQTLSARLGLVTGRDLAQACRDEYPRAITYVLFVLCEIAIAACDLAEVLGTAIGLNLLFGIPVVWAVLITGLDVLLLLGIQRLGIRKLEAFILMLVSIIGLCFLIEIFLCKPDAGEVVSGFVPRGLTSEGLLIAIGILGATVMPHNLYLHSALVQSRDVTRSRQAVVEACKFNLFDSALALQFAFLINAAILIVASATFFGREPAVTTIQQAHEMLDGLLGARIAPYAFAVALLCAGQSSTITGTLAGQITMEGFLRFRIRPWIRRLITRSVAVAPAVAVVLAYGDAGIYKLLILSQVILSLQLSFAVVPLVRFTCSKRKMGPFVSRGWAQILAWAATVIIIILNATLVFQEFADWIAAAGKWGTLLTAILAPIAAGLAILLGWMIFRREKGSPEGPAVSAEDVVSASASLQKRFRRIGVALDAKPSDSFMLGEAVALAKTYGAELVLMHVVDGAGGQWFGPQTGMEESREDEIYLQDLAQRLRDQLQGQNVPVIDAVLGFGDPSRELLSLAKEKGVDLMVMGGHGHRGLLDLVHGETITGVRHRLRVPILTVRE